jgi:hypothetical protein
MMLGGERELISGILFSSYFILVVFGERLERLKPVKYVLKYFIPSCIFVVAMIMIEQLTTNGSLVLTRISPGGFHTSTMFIFLIIFVIFLYYPKGNITRAMTLVIYIMTIHEFVWNFFYYGIVKQNLATYFLFYNLPGLSVMVFTIIVSWKRFKHYVLKPTVASCIMGLIYGWFWLSMGFPMTVGTFETPQLTINFNDPFTNMIELGYCINFIGSYMTAYILEVRYKNKISKWIRIYKELYFEESK